MESGDLTSSDYFKSYEDLEVHNIMLQDTSRNHSYKKAIFENKRDFQDKVVMDVGAGTGFLSVLCAKAGAKTVYAIEASNMAKIAEEIVKENGYEGVIKVINKRVEDVELPEKVDVIVSEWMGFYLLHEAMLDSVIVARDKFLKPNGVMYPESATLYAAPCSVPSMNTHWDNVEGVSMKTFAEQLKQNALKKPVIEIISSDMLLSEPEVVVWLNLVETTIDDIKCIKTTIFPVAKTSGQFEGIALWFTCTFPTNTDLPITLTTRPGEMVTHWKQATIVLPTSTPVMEGDTMPFDLSMTKSLENDRQYTIEVTMLDPDEVEHPEGCKCQFTKCILVRAMLEQYERQNGELPLA